MTPTYPKPIKIASLASLREAWDSSADAGRRGKAPGIDGRTPTQFGADLTRNLEIVRAHLISGKYEFKPLRPIPIRKPNSSKYRLICVPSVEDRLVQRLLCNYITCSDKFSIFNRVSYGFIKGRGVRRAVRRTKEIRRKYPWAYKSDITSFFDEIDRTDLIANLERKLGRSSIIPILNSAIQCEHDTSHPDTKKIAGQTGIRAGKGLRQGMPLSPLLSNFVLKRFDRHFERRRYKLIRYADDFIIFGGSEEECQTFHNESKMVLSKLGFDIPDVVEDSKTIIRNPYQSIDFLGYELTPSHSGTGFDIMIPKSAFDEVSSRLQIFSDFDATFHRFRTFNKANRRINNIVDGFLGVYKFAHNYSDFENSANDRRSNAVRHLLRVTLGKHVFDKLDKRRRDFLELLE